MKAETPGFTLLLVAHQASVRPSEESVHSAKVAWKSALHKDYMI
jgi:hypothetical protein